MSAKTKSNWLVLFSLIFAGEMIFGLPFHVARFFRPTLLESFSLTNTALGDTFAFYGITAMICYLPGGVIADYFSTRKMLTISLIATAFGGFYFATFPNGTGLTLLFGYWGITSVLLFWSGMIKATREWGGSSEQGRAFGLLDGGRGLVAAVISTIGVYLFTQFIISSNIGENQANGLKAVIYFYTFITFLAAFIIWKCIPESESTQKSVSPWVWIKETITSSRVWLQSLIIISAYCAFKGADNYGVYAVDVLNMSHTDAATFTSLSAYLRPIGAIFAGLLADKYRASSVIKWNFFGLGTLYLILSFSWNPTTLFNLNLFNLVVSFLAVFALRGIYFALVEESKVSSMQTGTAVGFISLIGYTPDIFFASVSGRILDNNPGVIGFENYFLLLMGIALIGLVMSILLNKKNLDLQH